MPFIFAAAMLLGVVSVAGAGSFDGMSERAEKCGVSSESIELVRKAEASRREGLLAPLLAACVEQLPLEPLQDKLAEGMAKRVPLPLVVRALERRLASYEQARELLLTTVGALDPAALAIVGEGMDKGVPAEDFEIFAKEFGSLPSGMFVTGVAMVSLQGQAGFNIDLTLRIVREGAEDGTLSPDWRYFIRTILAARGHGVGDEAVAEGAVAVLRQGGAVANVAEVLGFTDRDLEGSGER